MTHHRAHVNSARSGRSARSAAEWEALPVARGRATVYADDGSGEPTPTVLLAGATPQFPEGAIPKGATSNTSRIRKGARRRVATQRVPRMGRKVRPQRSRWIPSLFVSSGHHLADIVHRSGAS